MVEPVRCVVMGRWRECRAASRQRHDGTFNLIPHREGSSMSVVLLDLLLICVALFLTGTMISVAILVD